VSVVVHHRVDGPEGAPPLVLAGSLGTTLAMWDAVVGALVADLRLIRHDHRGHGRSPVPNGPYSIAALADDALALLDRLSIERASFAGVSLGGMVGMWLAIHAPERIDRLLLCCTSAHMPPPEAWTERAATVRERGMRAVADATLERWFTPGFRERRPEAVKRALRALLGTPGEGYAACCEAIAGHDLRDQLAAVRAPTLVISAADDPATPPEHGRLIADAVARARHVVLDSGRHLVAAERPTDVSRLLLEHVTAGATA
jgi:3-oxoadipate enol-lactonase